MTGQETVNTNWKREIPFKTVFFFLYRKGEQTLELFAQWGFGISILEGFKPYRQGPEQPALADVLWTEVVG